MADKTRKLTRGDDDVPATAPTAPKVGAAKAEPTPAEEFGGRKGPEPTRYGDWEKNGLISDF